MPSTITIPIDAKTSAKLNELSRQRDCSSTQLAQLALQQFIDLQTWQVQAIEEGIEAADQGRLIDHHDLRSQWKQKLGNQMD